MKKRILSAILAAMLVCTLLPIQAGAFSTGIVGQPETVSAGQYLSLAIKPDGSLWAWGDPTNVIFGKQTGAVQPRKTPNKVMDNVVSVSTGSYHTLIIKTDSTLWAIGPNTNNGEVGDGTTETRYTPVKIMDNVAAVSTGQYNSYAIKTDGTLWAWGQNSYGSLGDGTQENRHSPVKILDNVKAVSSTGAHAMAVKTDGTLWVWGDRFYQDSRTIDKLLPIKAMDNVKDIAMGSAVSVVLKEDGTVWTFAGMPKPPLDNPNSWSISVPVKVLDNVKKVSSGYNHALALKEDGTLWSWMTWGTDNKSGQLGNGTTACNDTPTKILDNVATMSAGGHHSLAVKKDGTLWAWGKNDQNQIGDGTRNDQLSPVKVLDGVHYAGTSQTTPSAPVSTTGFSDVPASAYYSDAVSWAVKNNITAGTSATTFSPDATCTQVQILTFLWRAAGEPVSTAQLPFTLNAKLNYADGALRWAYEKKLIDASFNQNAPCTRSDAVKFIWQAAGSPSAAGSSFSDVPASADYAQAVDWAVANNVTAGTSTTTFSPNVTCTRAQIVTFLYRSNTNGK